MALPASLSSTVPRWRDLEALRVGNDGMDGGPREDLAKRSGVGLRLVAADTVQAAAGTHRPFMGETAQTGRGGGEPASRCRVGIRLWMTDRPQQLAGMLAHRWKNPGRKS